MLQVRLATWFLGLGEGWGKGFPLACTHCGILEPDPRMLNFIKLVSRPGAGAHSAGVCSLQTSGSFLGGTALLTSGPW